MDIKTRSPTYERFISETDLLRSPSQQTTFERFVAGQKIDLNTLSAEELAKVLHKFKIWNMYN